jgi:hypothetical protein
MASLLDDIEYRTKVTESLLVDIDDACLELHPQRHSRRVGMSTIGEPCARKLWNRFRHLKMEPFSGRMKRLFDRGNLEEARFIKWLEKAGFELQAFDSETGKQFEVSDCNGHFSGFLDAKVKLPAKYGIDDWLVTDFKTWKEDTKWRKLLKEGILAIKPEHHAQLSMYGYKSELEFGLYLAICKNDDRIYAEILSLNKMSGTALLNKALTIITAPTNAPPAKISQQRGFFSCKWCHFQSICHDGESVEKNCRSCMHASATNDAQWYCDLHNSIIPSDFIPKGCDSYNPIQ